MATAQDIISRALKSLGVIGQGQSGDSDQLADGLVSLNDLLVSWSNEKLMVYQIVQESITMVGGQTNYDIGVGATSLNTVRPISIEQAFIRLNGIDYPVECISREQYQSITIKTISTPIPSCLYYNTGYPTSTIQVWPAPSGGQSLYIDSWKPFSEFASLSTTVALPPGYERALRLNLAVELMPEYQVQNPQLIAMASEAKAGIKRANFNPDIMAFDSAIPQGRNSRYNIYADTP